MSWLSKLFDKKPKFEVGDIVKCIDDRDHSVVYGKEYKVLDRTKTTCCNSWVYDVGLRSYILNTVCPPCGNVPIQGKGIHWCGEFRFSFLKKEKAKAQIEECISIETKKILTEEIEHMSAN